MSNKSPDIILEALLEKRAKKAVEHSFHINKADAIQEELNVLDKAILNGQGRLRKERIDKGKARPTKKRAMTLKVVKKLRKRGRSKQLSLLAQYDKDATFGQKLVFAISSANRFVHNREIAEIIFVHDQSVSVDILVERLSARANKYKKDGLIVAYLVGGNIRNTVYGLPGWLDDNREIKEGYEYRETYLVGKKQAI